MKNMDNVRDIRESLKGMMSLAEFIKENQNDNVNEGLKDILAKIKTMFRNAVAYLKGVVAKMKGPLWMPTDDEGNILPAVSPLTMGACYVDGAINTASTLVCLDKDGARLTGLRTKPQDAEKLYGSGNSIAYWRRLLKENQEETTYLTINEDGLFACSETPITIKRKFRLDETKTPDDFDEFINEVKLANTDPSAKHNVVDTPALKKHIKLHLLNPKLPRLMIWGAPGIGKTAILRSVLSEIPNGKDYRLVCKTLSNETPDNFTLPKYCEVDNMGVDGKPITQTMATDVPKTWLPVYKPQGDPAKDKILDDALGKGLLFIDELSRATQQVLNVCLPLINEGEFNGWKLGSGWIIIAASNRMEDDEASQSEIGNALSNRFAQVYYEPTVYSWEEWAKQQNYISPLLLQWLKLPESETMSGGKYFYYDPNESGNNDPSKLMCTPRSWTNAMQTLATVSETGKLEGWTIFDLYNEDREFMANILNQYVPAEAVDSFMAFLHTISSVGDFEKFCDSVWHKKGAGAKLSAQANKVAIPICQLLITSMDPNKHYPTAQEFESLADWIVATGNDQICTFMLDTLIGVYMPGETSDLRAMIFMGPEWIKKNSDRLASINASLDDWFSMLNSKYGMNVTSIEDIPNWYAGYKKLLEKFKGDIAKTQIGDGFSIL